MAVQAGQNTFRHGMFRQARYGIARNGKAGCGRHGKDRLARAGHGAAGKVSRRMVLFCELWLGRHVKGGLGTQRLVAAG